MSLFCEFRGGKPGEGSTRAGEGSTYRRDNDAETAVAVWPAQGCTSPLWRTSSEKGMMEKGAWERVRTDGGNYVLKAFLGSSFLVLCLLPAWHVKALACFDRSGEMIQ